MAAMRDRWWPWLVLAAAMRLWIGLQPGIPARDGANYLWMAQQFAAGHPAELFRNIFHPLYPFLVGGVLRAWPALDPVVAGRCVAAGCSAVAVVPLWTVTRRLFGANAAAWAALMFAIGNWFVRHPVECMSEGPFHLAAVLWAAAVFGGRPRPGVGGAMAGLAYLARPEGALLLLAGAVVHARRDGRGDVLRHFVAGGAVAALLPCGALLTGSGFVVTPKVAFNWEVGVGGAADGGWFYLRELAKLPGDAWEGLGYVVFPLLLLGLWWTWRGRLSVPIALAMALPLLVFCGVIPFVKSNHRFVSGLGVLLVPFAGAAAARLAVRRWVAILLVLLLVGSEAKLWLTAPPDRSYERELGVWLAGQLAPDETVCSDVARIVYFAGRKPPPPRTLLAEDLRGWARASACRFLALREGRTIGLADDELRDLGFALADLPPAIAERAARGRIAIWRRAPR